MLSLAVVHRQCLGLDPEILPAFPTVTTTVDQGEANQRNAFPNLVVDPPVELPLLAIELLALLAACLKIRRPFRWIVCGLEVAHVLLQHAVADPPHGRRDRAFDHPMEGVPGSRPAMVPHLAT